VQGGSVLMSEVVIVISYAVVFLAGMLIGASIRSDF